MPLQACLLRLHGHFGGTFWGDVSLSTYCCSCLTITQYIIHMCFTKGYVWSCTGTEGPGVGVAWVTVVTARLWVVVTALDSVDEDEEGASVVPLSSCAPSPAGWAGGAMTTQCQSST